MPVQRSALTVAVASVVFLRVMVVVCDGLKMERSGCLFVRWTLTSTRWTGPAEKLAAGDEMPFKAPSHAIPPELAQLDYDGFRDIRDEVIHLARGERDTAAGFELGHGARMLVSDPEGLTPCFVV